MNNIKRVISYFTALPLLVFVIGCNANGSVSEDLCKLDAPLELNLPKLVIVGTDVVNIESFQSSKKVLAKSYSAELGGATLTFLVTSDSKSTDIVRTFQEPGEPNHNNVYKSVCIYNDTIQAQNFIGKIVDDGVLLLEKEPNVDGIPVDLWILYNEIK
ncbi:MAG: hypothetical protein GY787_32275 [Alteromonadales bacterium]|nr:hypothetical protein [Alteromonadales bacterium]